MTTKKGIPLDEERALNVDEAAALLGVSPKWIKRRTTTGEVPSVKLGRCRRYRRTDLLAFMAARTGAPAP